MVISHIQIFFKINVCMHSSRSCQIETCRGVLQQWKFPYLRRHLKYLLNLGSLSPSRLRRGLWISNSGFQFANRMYTSFPLHYHEKNIAVSFLSTGALRLLAKFDMVCGNNGVYFGFGVSLFKIIACATVTSGRVQGGRERLWKFCKIK